MNLRLHLFIYASLDNKNDRIEDKKYRLINRVFSSLVLKKASMAQGFIDYIY